MEGSDEYFWGATYPLYVGTVPIIGRSGALVGGSVPSVGGGRTQYRGVMCPL